MYYGKLECGVNHYTFQNETVLQHFEGEAFIILLANNGWFIQLNLADKS